MKKVKTATPFPIPELNSWIVHAVVLSYADYLDQVLNLL